MKKHPYRPSLLHMIILLWIGSILLPFSQALFNPGIAWAQREEKEVQETHYIQLMKQLKIKVEGWLKALNERIESEEVTRFEVRFLEILRSLLEWVGEKIEGEIESGKKRPPRKIKEEDV